MPGPDAEGGIHYLLDPFKFPIIAEVDFTCSATEYEWTVPAGITSITAVLIGGGASGGAGGGQTERNGGGGGALRWVNGLVVTPGETLKIGVGLGGTSQQTLSTMGGGDFRWGRPGKHSYIASTNNANVPARSGIGGTIIVIAQGGGWDNYISDTQRRNPSNSNTVTEFPTNNSQSVAKQTVGVGTSGGQGTAFGSYSWGTVGGGNGGMGGASRGIGGGQDGGGGGAGGYAGNGGIGGDSDTNPTNGSGGSGGGGMFDAGGGAYGAGGGGGTGLYWGIGPNGQCGGYMYPGATLTPLYDFGKTGDGLGNGGQAGSFGADGKASGCDIIRKTDYDIANINNYPNGSNGNGLRGFSASLGDNTSIRGDGGLYGGGGGGCQLASGSLPQSGAGACGHVRIIFSARTDFIIREYGSGRYIPQSRTIKGQTVSVQFDDFNPGINTTTNLSNGWPSWYPTPSTGIYYNLLINWASDNLPSGDTDFPIRTDLPSAATGISSNPYNLPV